MTRTHPLPPHTHTHTHTHTNIYAHAHTHANEDPGAVSMCDHVRVLRVCLGKTPTHTLVRVLPRVCACVLQCVAGCVAVCVAVCCSVYARTHSWQDTHTRLAKSYATHDVPCQECVRACRAKTNTQDTHVCNTLQHTLQHTATHDVSCRVTH